MKGVKPPGGYTIVEVMIVLAVSGVMFVMAANFINGKNARTQFQQGSNELGSRMQGVIEEVTDGQYTDIPFTCSRAGSSLAVTGAVRPQGTNPECVFIGKLAHFSVNPNPSGFGSGDRTKYEVFTLAGERSIGSTQPDLTNTHIVAVEEYPPLAIPQINLTKLANVPQNLDISAVQIIGEDGSRNGKTEDNTYDVGFMQGFGTSDAANNPFAAGTFQSGAQSVSLVYIPNVDANQSNTGLRGKIKHPPPVFSPARSAKICITDGSRQALVNIGTNNNQLNVEVKQLGQGGAVRCGLY
jgi:prepilin-type N-terminal cleavage/methylation domain-containing protein